MVALCQLGCVPRGAVCRHRGVFFFFFIPPPPRFYGMARIKSESYGARLARGCDPTVALDPRGHTCEPAGNLRVTLQAVHGLL